MWLAEAVLWILKEFSFFHQTFVVLSMTGNPSGCEEAGRMSAFIYNVYVALHFFLCFHAFWREIGKGSVKGCEPDAIFKWKLDILCI